MVDCHPFSGLDMECIRCEGGFHRGTVDSWRMKVESALNGGEKVIVLDLASATEIDSVAVSVLREIRTISEDRRAVMLLENVSDEIVAILKVLHLDRQFFVRASPFQL
ncbi:MAG: STAS domain-containing protein [Gemmatimonadaceae bacterium]